MLRSLRIRSGDRSGSSKFLLLALVAGCGGATTTPATSNESQSEAASHEHSVNTFENNPGASSDATEVRTHSPVLLGHFSSRNGMHGLVLDRTGEQPLMRVDGTNEVIVLTAEPAPRGDTWLKRPDGGNAMRIMSWGGIEYYAGGETHHLVRDADAAPLSAP